MKWLIIAIFLSGCVFIYGDSNTINDSDSPDTSLIHIEGGIEAEETTTIEENNEQQETGRPNKDK